MPLTTNQYVNVLVDVFTPSPSEFDAARGHRASIETSLKSGLQAFGLIETGSLSHGTAVSRRSDADYFVLLPGPRPLASTALSKVRDTLKFRFPSTQIRVSSPAVVCKFVGTDRSVEIIPAYSNGDGGFLIPDPQSGGWMESNPRRHLDYVTAVSKKHNGDPKKMIRLLKAWKYTKGVPISSFYLEMRGAKHAAGIDAFIIFWNLCLTLEKMVETGLVAMNDPTKTGPRFNACSTEAYRQDALSRTRTAAVHARRAVTAYKADQHDVAIKELKLLFGL